MFAFLQFVWSDEELQKWCCADWCKNYDMNYIENDIIKKSYEVEEKNQWYLVAFRHILLQNQIFWSKIVKCFFSRNSKKNSFEVGQLPEGRALLDEVSLMATGTTVTTEETTTQKVKKITTPAPFNLTKPKPRLIPNPDVISREVKSMPIPESLYKTSVEEIEAEKEARRQKLKEEIATKYDPADEPKLFTRERGIDIDKLRSDVEQMKLSECTFAPEQCKPYSKPAFKEYKVNTASILREDALVRFY